MDIKILQSLIASNRGEISYLHKLININKEASVYYKQDRDGWIEDSENYVEIQNAVDGCYAYIAKCSKQIKKLVIIQKSLKKAIADEVYFIRHCKSLS